MVQWKLPASVSSFVQRAGRAARGLDRVGLAVLLVERSVYDADLLAYMESAKGKKISENPKKSRKANVRASTNYPRARDPKAYAQARGVLRGGHNQANDGTGEGTDIPIDPAAIDEGLHTLSQTGTCRRCVLTRVYSNRSPGECSEIYLSS